MIQYDNYEGLSWEDTHFDMEPNWWKEFVKTSGYCNDPAGPAITEAERERMRLLDLRIKALPITLAEARRNAMILSDVKAQPAKSAKPYNGGPFLPWHSAPPSTTPALVFAVPSPKLDNHVAHASRVGEKIGEYCGTPIVTLDTLGMEVDIERETYNRVHNSSGPGITAEIMSGEVLCKDNIIRRGTTAEVRGDEYYNNVKNPANTKRVRIADARVLSHAETVVSWRPNMYRATDNRVMFWDANGKPADKNAVQRDAMVFNDDTDYALLHAVENE